MCNRLAVEVGASKLANTFEGAVIVIINAILDAANVFNQSD